MMWDFWKIGRLKYPVLTLVLLISLFSAEKTFGQPTDYHEEIMRYTERHYPFSQVNPDTVEKIYGGDRATRAQIPWHVAINKTAITNNLAANYCGASILNETFLITAAHCVCKQSGKWVAKDEIDISYGGTDLSVQIRHPIVSKIIPFDTAACFKSTIAYPAILQNDLALIKVSSPFIFSETVKKVEIYTDKNELIYKTPLITSGYGRESQSGETSVNLRWVEIPYQTRERCNNANVYKGGVTQQMICAGRLGANFCKGDSGGPLVLKNSLSQVGVVSWTSKCEQPNSPGVYTNLPEFISWIELTIAQN